MRDEALFKDAIAKIAHLNPSPAIVASVMKAMGDDLCSMTEIIERLRTDTVFTGEIIRVSNTAYYNLGNRVTNLEGALSRIGFAKAKRIISTSMAGCIHDPVLSNYGICADDYWVMGVSAALVLEKLAAFTGEDAGEYYTLGILHALGRLVINELINHFKIEMLWDSSIPINEWEEDAVGFNYTEAGAFLLEQWNFSPDFVDSVRYQLNPSAAPEPTHMLYALNFCVELLGQTAWEFTRAPNVSICEHPFALRYELTLETLETLTSSARTELIRLRESLK